MNLRSLDLNLLPILDALLSEWSTTRAAARLGLSQSAVSAALGRLRGHFGDPLLVRQGQRLVPTEFAQQLEVPLKDLLRGIHHLFEGPDGFNPLEAENAFKLSGSDFYAELLMPRLGEIFSRSAPKMTVQMVDLVPDSYVGSINREEIDIALVPQTAFPEWVAAQPVHMSGFAVAARKNHPRLLRAGLRPGDVMPVDLLCDLGHVLFSPEGKLRGMGDAALARIGRSRRVVMTLPVFSGVLNVVSASDHLAIMPAQIAILRGPTFGTEVYRLPFAMPIVEINMIWHRRHTSSLAHQWLRGQVSDVLRPLSDLPFPGEQTSP